MQLLPLELVEQFQKWQEEIKAAKDSKVFGNFDKSNAAKMLRKDLQVAKIAYKDDAVAQSLTRHSTISLTMDTYTHLSLNDGKAALARLPKLPDVDSTNTEGSRAAALKTGTDDEPTGTYKPAYKK